MTQDNKTKENNQPKSKVKKKNGKKPGITSKAKELQEKLTAEQDKNLRLQAEFENYRKRMFKELSDAQWFGKMAVMEPVLKVFDTFFLALQAAKDVKEDDPLKQGLQLIYNEFNKTLDELNVEQIDAEGVDFDHNLHEAVAYEESDTVPEGKIIKQWNCGYKIVDRIIRPASVVVSCGNPKNGETDDQKE